MSPGKTGIRVRSMATAAAAAVLLSGCYHAVINTGIQPGPRTVEEKWAMSYIGGLVPPDPVYAEQQCGENGVARVETRHSFLNQLVAGLTFSIFTPIEIVVTCGRSAEEDAAASSDAPPPSGDGTPSQDVAKPGDRDGNRTGTGRQLER